MSKPQSVNMNADSGQKTWLTPRRIVDALGPFDTDPCTPCFMPWRTATTMYNVFDDGTTAPWHGRVWLNPPYGREAVPFMRRMAGHPGGGYRARLRPHRDEALAGARLPGRPRRPLRRGAHPLLPRGRHGGRVRDRAVRAHRLLGAGCRRAGE